MVYNQGKDVVTVVTCSFTDRRMQTFLIEWAFKKSKRHMPSDCLVDLFQVNVLLLPIKKK